MLYTPTISRYWSFTLISEAEEEDAQAQAEKPAAGAIDSLVKPAVPSRCFEEEIEFSLSSRLFADWKTQVTGALSSVDKGIVCGSAGPRSIPPTAAKLDQHGAPY